MNNLKVVNSDTGEINKTLFAMFKGSKWAKKYNYKRG